MLFFISFFSNALTDETTSNEWGQPNSWFCIPQNVANFHFIFVFNLFVIAEKYKN